MDLCKTNVRNYLINREEKQEKIYKKHELKPKRLWNYLKKNNFTKLKLDCANRRKIIKSVKEKEGNFMLD